jgi:1,4-alpha-glucan branching enzyme
MFKFKNSSSKKSVSFALALIITSFLYGQQLVSISPAFASAADNNVVITYDASLGNAGLLGEASIYAHTGVITSSSTSGSDWKYVIAGWGVNLPKALLIRIGTSNKYTLNIGNIRTYYGVPANETILKIALVFRNSNGSKTGKTTSNGDIFVDVSQGGYQLKFNEPNKASFFVSGDSVNVHASASNPSVLRFFANGIKLLEDSNSTQLSRRFALSELGSNRIDLVLEGIYNGTSYYDSSYVIEKPNTPVLPIPNGMVEGINYINDTTVTLVLFAPLKEFVYVLGDFNNWEFRPEMLMNRTIDQSRYWLTITGLEKGKEYAFQYIINGQMRVADVYADKFLDPWNDQWISKETFPDLMPYPAGKTTEVVSVLKIGEAPFDWKNSSYTRPDKHKLIVYEMLLRDFIGKHDFKTLTDTLSYFKRLGINCIQLMPIMEFEGNESWGYNPMFYFAVDKYYGSKNEFKAFVDACHGMGIAVVLDIALNHSFGQNPQVRMYFNPAAGQYGQPTADNPWFNQVDKHPFGVGYDYNHEATVVQNFTDRVIKYWISEYKIDGYRFDLSKGFTQKNTGSDVSAWNAYDQSRVNIWSRIRNEIIKYAPDAYLILEHLGDNSEEKVLADMGFMMWGKMTENYAEALMGFNNSKSNLSWGNYKSRNFTQPNLVTYAESHDEERVMFSTLTYGNSNANYSTKNLDNALRRVAAYHALLLPLRGPKMIWQGGELGYEVSINTNGRLGNKPFRWNYLSDAKRMQTYYEIAAINKLKQEASLNTDNFVYDVAGTVKYLRINGDSLKTVIAANFDIVPLTVTPGFMNTGTWYNYISGDSLLVITPQQTVLLQPGEYRIYTSKPLKSDLPAGLENEISASQLNCYPNPFQQKFTVSSSFGKITQVEVQDMLNRTVLVQTEHKTQLVEVDLSGARSGMYVIKVSTDRGTQLFKVIKED